MSEHRNFVKMSVSGTPGTGTITLGSAVLGFQSLATAYAADATVDVSITDGTAWEVARDCTYTHSGTTLTRGTLEESSTGSALSLTSAAVVTVTSTAAWGNLLEQQLNRGLVFVRNNGSTTQTLTATTSTKIAAALTTVVSDDLSEWSVANKRFTPTRAGKYLAIFGVQAGATSSVTTCQLYKNGAFTANGIGYGTTTFCTAQATFIADCTTANSDYFEFYAYSNVTQNTNAAATNTYVQFIYLGP